MLGDGKSEPYVETKSLDNLWQAVWIFQLGKWEIWGKFLIASPSQKKNECCKKVTSGMDRNFRYQDGREKASGCVACSTRGR